MVKHQKLGKICISIILHETCYLLSYYHHVKKVAYYNTIVTMNNNSVYFRYFR